MSGGFQRWMLGGGALALVGALVGVREMSQPPAPAADIRIITHGDEVDLGAHVVRGKYTVFDFYAPWCPPCRIIGPALERLAERRSASVALRKVDIVDWTMPVATQYRIESLPYLVLYDQEGRRMAQGDDVYPAIKRLFGDAARELNEAAGTSEEATAPGAKTSGS